MLACVTLLAATAACTGPTEGVDGDLYNGWAPLPAPVQWRPAAGTCFDDVVATVTQDKYAPIDCVERHLAETYHVGDLTGPGAAAGAINDAGGTARKAAYAECSRRATAFVGGDWHTGRLWVEPVLPGGSGWAGGARWFRCDLVEQATDGSPIGRSGSLGRILSGAAPLALKCFNPELAGSSVRTMTPIACGRPHHAEFVGLWTAPAVKYGTLPGDPRLARGCRAAIARFAALPNDTDLRYRVGWLGLAPGQVAWAAGDRSVRCYLWLSREELRGSYRGAGPSRLPIHFA
jgi:hypothetical protein